MPAWELSLPLAINCADALPTAIQHAAAFHAATRWQQRQKQQQQRTSLTASIFGGRLQKFSKRIPEAHQVLVLRKIFGRPTASIWFLKPQCTQIRDTSCTLLMRWPTA